MWARRWAACCPRACPARPRRGVQLLRSIVHKIHRNYEPSLSDEVQSVLGVEAGRIFLFLWVLLRTLNVLHLLTMTAPAFDTLKFTRRLQQAGISVEQAEAQAEAINEALESQLATKIDILQLDKKIDDVASRLDKKIDGAVSGLDNKIDAVDNKIDLAALLCRRGRD